MGREKYSGHISSCGTQTSIANAQIYFHDRNGDVTEAYYLNFIPDTDCHVVLNDQDTLPIEVRTGEVLEVDGEKIKTLKILEGGVPYRFTGAF